MRDGRTCSQEEGLDERLTQAREGRKYREWRIRLELFFLARLGDKKRKKERMFDLASVLGAPLLSYSGPHQPSGLL